MTSLRRRVNALADVADRHLIQQVAREYGITVDVDQFLAAVRRWKAEEQRLRAQGCSERELRRAQIEQMAAEAGVDPDELEVEMQRILQERGLCLPG